MKKIFSFFITLGIIFTSVLSVCAQTNIECSYTIEGNTINVTGKVNDINRSCQVTIFVGTVDNIIYLNQKTSESDGSFAFEFSFPDDLPYGEYDLGIGSNTGAPAYKGTINYVYVPPKVEREFLFGDFSIDINHYIATLESNLFLSGEIRGIDEFEQYDGKLVTLSIVDVIRGNTISDNTIYECGGWGYAQRLLDLRYNNEYSINLNCTEKGNSLLKVNITIESNIILVSVVGQVEVADNVKLDVSFKTTDSSLINKSAIISSDQTVSYVIPNLPANMEVTFSLVGIETVTEEAPEIPSDEYDEEYENQTFDTFYIVSGENGAYKDLVMHFTNIADVENSLFTIQYDSSALEIADLCALTAEKEICAGVINGTNIEIVSVTDGKVQIKYNYDTTNGKIMTGNLNVIRFKKLTSSETVITSATERMQ